MIPSAPVDQTQPATAYADAGEGDRVADRASTYAYDRNGRLSVIHPTDRAPLRFNYGRPTPSTSTIPHGHRRLSAEPGSSDDDHSATSIPETARPGIYTYDASPRTFAPPRCTATDSLPVTARNARAFAPRHDYGATTISLWLSRDPIGERGGANLYGMIGNDPIGKADFLGLSEILLVVKWAPGLRTARNQATLQRNVDRLRERIQHCRDQFGLALDVTVRVKLKGLVDLIGIPVEMVPNSYQFEGDTKGDTIATGALGGPITWKIEDATQTDDTAGHELV